MSSHGHARLRRLLSLLLSVNAVGGCTYAVVPPDRVVRPTPVAVLDHGRHASLLVETRDDAMVQYAYGDWQWYARQQTDLGTGVVAILAPSAAALGRMRHAGPLTPEAVARQIDVAFEDALYFEVDRDAAEALIDRLDAIFHANQEMRVMAYGLVFVPHPEPYTLVNNSNAVVAAWLRELGAEVDGPALLGTEWRCRSPGDGLQHDQCDPRRLTADDDRLVSRSE